MNDFKSKLPDFKEITSMAGKLFKDIKTSVSEIIDDYKIRHAQEEETTEEVVSSAKKKPSEKPTVDADKTKKPRTKESVKKPEDPAP